MFGVTRKHPLGVVKERVHLDPPDPALSVDQLGLFIVVFCVVIFGVAELASRKTHVLFELGI